jgi:hypothetical protein
VNRREKRIPDSGSPAYSPYGKRGDPADGRIRTTVS